VAQKLLATASGGPLWTACGRYAYALNRTPGGWRITAQTLTARWAGGNRQILQPDQGGTFLD
jgi:hypothetical protein